MAERASAPPSSCARCGGRVPLTRAGKPKQGVRYCSARCRTADVRDRRAQARAPLFSCVQATWNLLERSVGPALQEAHDAGWGVVIKEAMANGRLAHTPGADALALAAVLRQPFVDVVLSGASTVAQLQSNLLALQLPGRDVDRVLSQSAAVAPERYWSERAQLPWT